MKKENENRQAYFIGGGIASLAGAEYLIRDCNFPGKNIHIMEGLQILGGSNDGAGNPKDGYVIRGGRMLNDETYENTWELFKTIPSIDRRDKSLREDITDFDNAHPTHSKARLVDKHGHIVDVTSMGFNNIDRLEMTKLIFSTEENIGDKKISDWFGHHFFKTNFWYMWATTFAFQPWSSAIEFKRYMLRFMHEFPRINTLAGVTRTPYNQYDSIILPMHKHLETFNVDFSLQCIVTDLEFKDGDAITVTGIDYEKDGEKGVIKINDGDLVFLVNGTMTDASSLGSMHSAPTFNPKSFGFKVWDNIAKKKSGMGNPSKFDDHPEESYWESFTVTAKGTTFFDLMKEFTGNIPGEGALCTLKDSNWLMSTVLAAQPHFRNQPEDVTVFWGYGLFPDKVGNFVKKRMRDCTGEEILTELVYQMKFEKHLDKILSESNCIPCIMPYITSQFMPRKVEDRPLVVPEGSTNFAMISQFVEIPDDVVFTEEYSVRAARTAVYKLMNVTDKQVEPLNQYQFDPKILFSAVQTSFR